MLHAESLQSCPTLCNPVDGGFHPARLRCPCDSSGNSTGVHCRVRSEYIHKSEITGSYGIQYLIFWLKDLFSIMAESFYILTHIVSSASSTTFVFLVFLMIAILTGVRWYLIVIFICISLMVRKVEHLFIYILAICISSLEKVFFRFLAILIEFILFYFIFIFYFFCYWTVWNLHIFWILTLYHNPLSDTVPFTGT